jgi:DNA polymerase III delta prime subunit
MEQKPTLWVEDFRPTKLEEMILNDFQRELFSKFITEKSIPHLLLYGNVGSGKTTIAKILLDHLDCERMELNASSDRGIQVVRDKILQFAMIQTMKPLKVVLLEEFDATTPDFQYSLRNLMEEYSDNTRFLMTCNYVNKIIEPIRSRCQQVEFREFGKPQCFKHLCRILEANGITFDKGDVLTLVDSYYPDMRTMINTMQLNASKGVLNIASLKRFMDFSDVVDWIKKGDYKHLRENSYKFNFVDVYRYLFDHVDEFELNDELRVKASLSIAEYMYRDYMIADKEINFSALCLELMTLLGVKG